MQTLLQSTQAYQIVKTEGRENRFSHAYLLLFDDARNLRSALKTFAKLLLGCAQEENRISRLIDEESFSDCLFFPTEGKKLTVEDAERIREECTLSPVEGNKKVFVIGDFAEANVQTQNKLLKLLEEPPQGVIFLLGATSSFSVLPTVLSRTKKLEILSFEIQEVTECLSRIYGTKYDKDALFLCAATSNGNVGVAQNMLEGGHYKDLTENAFALVLSIPSKLPSLIKQIGETKQQKEILSSLRLIFRDALLLKTQGIKANRHLLLPSEKNKLLSVSEKYTLSALLYAQEALSDAEKQVTFNAVFSQCIEICIAKIQAKNK